jgi:hypothetical protein
MKYQRLSNVIKKPEKDIFIENKLDFSNNFRIIAIRTPMSSKSAELKPLRQFKASSSQLL